MQVLLTGEDVGREAPAVLALDNQVQRLLELPVQAPHVIPVVRLGRARQRGGGLDEVLGRDELRVVADALLGVAQQRPGRRGRVRQVVAHQQLVVPGARAAGVVVAEVLGDGAAALADLEVPVEAPRRVGLVVDGRDKGRVDALLEALLVEEEGVLKGVQRAGEQRRPRQDEAGADVVGGGRGGRRL